MFKLLFSIGRTEFTFDTKIKTLGGGLSKGVEIEELYYGKVALLASHAL